MNKVSVVIPTIGRTQEVRGLLNALAEQTQVPDEVIIADQNEPALPLEEWKPVGLKKLIHLRSTVKGWAHNVNQGLNAAQGEVVLILDDDVVPNRDLVERHLAAYTPKARGSGIVGVAGRVEQKGDPDPASIKRVGHYGRWTGAAEGNFSATEGREVLMAQGANMSFLRKALLDVGGFDTGFDIGSGYFVETDGCLSVTDRGLKIIFDPSASVVHLQAPRGGWRMTDKALHTYYFVRNGFRLYKKHSPLIGQPLFATRMALYVAAKAGYNLNPRIFVLGLKGVWDGWRKQIK